jgi:pimeloyl-ACP methyl ester carboxylesterase
MQGVDPSRAAAIGRVDYPRGYAEALRAATQIRWRKCLTFYEGPVLILNGEYDKPHVRYQADLLSTVRDGRIEAVKGAGHLANLDRPREFTAAVRSFARTVAGRAPGLL